jgi:serine/threonine-protein kinase
VPDALDRLKTALTDRYLIERELGAGGMATVYLAQDFKHGRRVAVKVLRPELAAVLGAERFVQEITTTASLQHPHILPLFDSGEADGFLYYVMPYIEGETLRQKLDRETQLGIDEAVTITTEVADALDYAHRHGVIHRDIKPENILLHDGRAMVADFGIALAVSAAAGGRMTETGLSLGTPHYMSPEQATAEKDLTNRSDIYSLGSVLFEMLTGDPPHTGSSAQQIIMKILTDEARSITELRKSVPPNVAAAVAKSLEKLPADRFASVADLRAALTNPSFRTEDQRVALSVKARSGALLAGGVVLGLLGGLLLRPGVSDPATGPLAAYLHVNLPAGVTLPLDRDYPVLAVSPDGSRLVFVGEHEGRRQLYTRLLADADARPIDGTEGALEPFFSSDGEWIGFLSGNMLFRVASAGGAPIQMRGVTGEGVSRGAAWISDTMLVVAMSPNSGLGTGIVPEDGIRDRVEWDSVTSAAAPAAWPTQIWGTTDVLFARSAEDDLGETDVALFSLETGRSRTLINSAISPRYAPPGYLLFARGAALHAVAYDAGTHETRGSEWEVLSGVAASGLGVSHYAVGAGTLAYVAGDMIPSDFKLVWIDRAGELVGTLHEGRRYGKPRISPDGRRVAVTVHEGPNSDVWVLDLTRNTLQPQTRHPGEDDGAVWAPDGSALALMSEVGEDRGELGPALAWIPELGGRTEQLVFTPEFGAWEFPTSWSPDGRSIIVATRRKGTSAGADIALFPLDGTGELVSLVETPADEDGARVSPDGAWLAYVSDASGRKEIWIRPFPGPGTAVQVSTNGGIEPVWSPDARELFYRSGLDMMAVDVAPGAELVLSPPRRLFTKRFEHTLMGGGQANFDISIDGQRFLMVRRKRVVQPTVIHVVLNWPSILLGEDNPVR